MNIKYNTNIPMLSYDIVYRTLEFYYFKPTKISRISKMLKFTLQKFYISNKMKLMHGIEIYHRILIIIWIHVV